MARSRRVGALSRGAQVDIEGMDDLIRGVRFAADQVRVEILDNAVAEGSAITRDKIEVRAPRAAGGPTRARYGHGADNIVIGKPRRRQKRDSRAKDVGPSWRVARHMRFAEWGTRNHPAQPFILPTFREMKKIQPKIVAKHMRRVLKKWSKVGMGIGVRA